MMGNEVSLVMIILEKTTEVIKVEKCLDCSLLCMGVLECQTLQEKHDIIRGKHTHWKSCLRRMVELLSGKSHINK